MKQRLCFWKISLQATSKKAAIVTALQLCVYFGAIVIVNERSTVGLMPPRSNSAAI
jgi:hypothetical protein